MSTATARIAAEAIRWVGTPFHWHATLKGEGCDCAGLLVGVLRSCGMPAPELPFYTPRTPFLPLALEALRSAGAIEVPWDAAAPGDALLWGTPDGQGAHLAILVEGRRMVHACDSGSRPRVVLTPVFEELPGFSRQSAWRLTP